MLSCICTKKEGMYLYRGCCGDDVFHWVVFMALEGKVQDIKARANNSFVV